MPNPLEYWQSYATKNSIYVRKDRNYVEKN